MWQAESGVLCIYFTSNEYRKNTRFFSHLNASAAVAGVCAMISL